MQRVVSDKAAQVPSFGNLVGSQGGDFVFNLQSFGIGSEELVDTNSRELCLKTMPRKERIIQARRLDASARDYLQENRLDLARAEWEEAVCLNPGNPTIVNNYGYILDQIDRNKEALIWYSKALQLSPNRIPLQLNLGDVLVELGRRHEAAPYYERYLDLAPNSPRADSVKDWLGSFYKGDQAMERRGDKWSAVDWIVSLLEKYF